MTRLRIEVPATTANLGPGFDALGLALDLLDTIDVELGGEEIVLASTTADVPDLDPYRNLFCDSYCRWGTHFGVTLPGARFTVESRIPVARGLGSSASCIVAGLAAAAWVCGRGDARDDVLTLASLIESHPDNAVAAVLGGLTAGFCDGENIHAIQVRASLPLDVVLFIPDRPLLTAEARASLPDAIPLRDAVFNISRAAYMVAALAAERWDALGAAMEDRLHQPYRLRHVPALNDIITAAGETGALGAALSGGGPSVLAFVPPERSEGVARAMEEEARRSCSPGRSLRTKVRGTGYSIVEI